MEWATDEGLATKDEGNNQIDEIGRLLVVHVVATVGDGLNGAVGVERLDLIVVLRFDVARSATGDEESGTVELADVRRVDPLRQSVVEQVDVETPLVVLRALRVADEILKKEPTSDGVLKSQM